MRKKRQSKRAFYIHLFLIIGIMLGILAFFDSDITGLAILDGNIKLFGINEINYDETLFVFDQGLKFKGVEEIIQEEGELYSLVVGGDYVDEFSSVDGNAAVVEDSFNIVLNREMQAGERIGFGMRRGLPCEVYVCGLDEDCVYPGLGGFEYDGNVGEYYIELSSGGSSFVVYAGDILRVDFLAGVYEGIIEEVVTIYPEEGFIETVDFSLENLESWGNIVKDDSGELVYFYSINSGETWNLIEGNDLSSADISSGKIRFKALFSGDGTETPILKKFGVTYDLASVGIEPVPGDVSRRESYDFDTEGTIPVKANSTVLIDFSDRTNLQLKFKNGFNGRFVKSRFFDAGLVPENLESIGRFEEITVSEDVNENLDSAVMKIYYDENEISGLDENSLKLYFYDESGWVELDSGVNIEENYVWANVDHFSVFAIFGEEYTAYEEEGFEEAIEELVEEEIVVEEIVIEEEEIVVEEEELISGEDLITGYSIVEGDIEGVENTMFVIGAVIIAVVLFCFVLFRKKS